MFASSEVRSKIADPREHLHKKDRHGALRADIGASSGFLRKFCGATPVRTDADSERPVAGAGASVRAAGALVDSRVAASRMHRHIGTHV